MQLCVYAKAYPGDTANQVRAAADDGFEGVEFRHDLDSTPLTVLDLDVFRAACELAAEAGLAVVTLALGEVRAHAPDQAGLRNVAALAAVSGARVRLFSSARRGSRDLPDCWCEPTEEDFRHEVDDLVTCVRALREGWPGVSVMLESEPYSVANTIARQARLIDTAQVPVGFNWDFVSTWMGGEYPWPGPWAVVEGRLLGVHYKAARADPHHPERYASQCAPPYDDLPHLAMWSAWAASGFYGPVTVDPHYHHFAAEDRFVPEPEAPTVELCRRSLRIMRDLRERAFERIGWSLTTPR